MHYYIYLRRPDGSILYDRTMGRERDADDRVTELEKRESVTEAWHQTDTHPDAFV